jgi:indole-3-glycerol phosphate synthase
VSGFLDEMAASSSLRVADALKAESFAALERRAASILPSPRLRMSAAGFDVIAEMKLRSPAAGMLGDSQADWLGRIAAYARGGAAAVSVLTEPSRFDGSLEHLRQAAQALAPLGIPAMRKDFIVDPYQVLEARAAGAGGVLLILRMLSRASLCELLEVASSHSIFVLLEAFDAPDLELAADILEARRASDANVLVGINCRDLQTLKVIPQRFAELAKYLPDSLPAVAESGVATPAEAQVVRRLGFGLALIGTALMASGDPAHLVAEILRSARTVES